MHKQANIVLLMSFLGVLASYPFREGGFFGGLFFHGFLAGFIGSLADWFAVTALFQKPLGISYRTDIIRHHRKRFEEALLDFLVQDLLKSERVVEHFKNISLGEEVRAYLKKETVQKRLYSLFKNILKKQVRKQILPLVANFLAQHASRLLLKVDTACLLDATSEFLQKEKMQEKLTLKCVNICRELYFSQSLQEELLTFLEDVKNSYVKDSMARAMMFETLELSEENMRQRLNSMVEEFLGSLEQKEGEFYQKLSEGIAKILQNIMTEANAKDGKLYLQNFLQEIGEKACTSESILFLLEDYYREHEDYILSLGGDFFLAKIEALMGEKQNLEILDKYVQEKLAQEITTRHLALRNIVEKRLKEFSDDDLVNLAREKFSADLQMIRINGAVIGSLVGILLYTLVFVAERGWMLC